MRLTILLVLWIVAGSSPPLEWLSLSAAMQQAEEESLPVVVYVNAPWCGPCLRLERETFSDPRVRGRLEQTAAASIRINAHDRIHRIDGFRISEADWARSLGIEATPALVLISGTGQVRAIHTGFISPEVLVAVIDELIRANGD